MPRKRMPIRNARPDDPVFTKPWATSCAARAPRAARPCPRRRS